MKILFFVICLLLTGNIYSTDKSENSEFLRKGVDVVISENASINKKKMVLEFFYKKNVVLAQEDLKRLILYMPKAETPLIKRLLGCLSKNKVSDSALNKQFISAIVETIENRTSDELADRYSLDNIEVVKKFLLEFSQVDLPLYKMNFESLSMQVLEFMKEDSKNLLLTKLVDFPRFTDEEKQKFLGDGESWEDIVVAGPYSGVLISLSLQSTRAEKLYFDFIYSKLAESDNDLLTLNLLQYLRYRQLRLCFISTNQQVGMIAKLTLSENREIKTIAGKTMEAIFFRSEEDWIKWWKSQKNFKFKEYFIDMVMDEKNKLSVRSFCLNKVFRLLENGEVPERLQEYMNSDKADKKLKASYQRWLKCISGGPDKGTHPIDKIQGV